MFCVDDDPARARDLARPWLTIYMGGMGAKGRNFYVDAAERAGHGESARVVQRLFLEGDRAGAAAALSDELIESNAVCTDMAALPERIAEFERAGVDTLLAMPFGDRPAVTAALADACAEDPPPGRAARNSRACAPRSSTTGRSPRRSARCTSITSTSARSARSRRPDVALGNRARAGMPAEHPLSSRG